MRWETAMLAVLVLSLLVLVLLAITDATRPCYSGTLKEHNGHWSVVLRPGGC